MEGIQSLRRCHSVVKSTFFNKKFFFKVFSSGPMRKNLNFWITHHFKSFLVKFVTSKIIKIDKKEASNEKMFELTIDAGGDECVSREDFHEIQCKINEIYNIKKVLEKNIKNFISTEIIWSPLNSVIVAKEKMDTTIDFLDTLEENDDVQNIFTNLKFGVE